MKHRRGSSSDDGTDNNRNNRNNNNKRAAVAAVSEEDGGQRRTRCGEQPRSTSLAMCAELLGDRPLPSNLLNDNHRLTNAEKVLLRRIVEAGGGSIYELGQVLKKLMMRPLEDERSDGDFAVFLIEHDAVIVKESSPFEIFKDPSSLSFATLKDILSWATYNDHFQVLDTLRRKFPRKFETKKNELFYDIRTLDMTKYLLDAGADFTFKNYAAVRTAAHNGHLDIVRFYVEQLGVDPKMPFILKSAAEEGIYSPNYDGKVRVVKYLLMNGANVAFVERDDFEDINNFVLPAVKQLILECDVTKLHIATCSRIKRTFLAVMRSGQISIMKQFVRLIRFVDEELDNERQRRGRISTANLSQQDKERIAESVMLQEMQWEEEEWQEEAYNRGEYDEVEQELTDAMLAMTIFYSSKCGSLLDAQDFLSPAVAAVAEAEADARQAAAAAASAADQ